MLPAVPIRLPSPLTITTYPNPALWPHRLQASSSMSAGYLRAPRRFSLSTLNANRPCHAWQQLQKTIQCTPTGSSFLYLIQAALATSKHQLSRKNPCHQRSAPRIAKFAQLQVALPTQRTHSLFWWHRKPSKLKHGDLCKSRRRSLPLQSVSAQTPNQAPPAVRRPLQPHPLTNSSPIATSKRHAPMQPWPTTNWISLLPTHSYMTIIGYQTRMPWITKSRLIGRAVPWKALNPCLTTTFSTPVKLTFLSLCDWLQSSTSSASEVSSSAPSKPPRSTSPSASLTLKSYAALMSTRSANCGMSFQSSAGSLQRTLTKGSDPFPLSLSISRSPFLSLSLCLISAVVLMYLPISSIVSSLFSSPNVHNDLLYITLWNSSSSSEVASLIKSCFPSLFFFYQSKNRNRGSVANVGATGRNDNNVGKDVPPKLYRVGAGLAHIIGFSWRN